MSAVSLPQTAESSGEGRESGARGAEGLLSLSRFKKSPRPLLGRQTAGRRLRSRDLSRQLCCVNASLDGDAAPRNCLFGRGRLPTVKARARG